jgi:hypothetical protein
MDEAMSHYASCPSDQPFAGDFDLPITLGIFLIPVQENLAFFINYDSYKSCGCSA